MDISMVGEYTVIIEEDADGFLLGEVLEIQGCHTHARDLDSLKDKIAKEIESRKVARSNMGSDLGT